MNIKQEMYQQVILVINGEKHSFIGPAVDFNKDEELVVDDIIITNAALLPEGCKFGKLTEKEKDDAPSVVSIQ